MDEHSEERPATPSADVMSENSAENLSANPQAPLNSKSRKRKRSRTRRCDFCKCRELRRQSSTLIESLCFLQVHRCGRCHKRNTHFQLTWWVAFYFMLLLAIPLGIHSWNVLTELPPEVNRHPTDRPKKADSFILEADQEGKK